MHFVPINYSDPDFDRCDLTKFLLLIILNQDTFSYAVRNPVTQQLVGISTGNSLNQLFGQNENPEILGKSYQKTIVAIQTNSFCLVPDTVFMPENLPDYAAFLSVKEADVVLTDQIENGKNTVVFTFPEVLVEKIKTQFPSVAIQFAPKSWIKTVFAAKLSGQNLYLYIEEKSLKILFPDQENIRFYNQFDCTSTDELIYFTALVADQLKLKPEETNLILCGRVEANGESILRLQHFFKNVKLFFAADYRQQSNLPQHQIVDFLSLS